MLFPVVIARMLGLKVPQVLTLQDGDPYEKVFERWFIKPVTPLLDKGFKNAAIIQVISTYLGTWPAKRGSKVPVVLIHNGANPKDLHDDVDPQAVEELKKKLGKKESDTYLVNTARLVYQKGNDDVIRALPMLDAHIKFLVVGEGPDEQMLKELTKELHLEDRVVFTGKVDRSVVTLYRRASDIFVCPSRSEGLGNAFLSAMASRLPVIATQEGGLAEFIFDTKHNPDVPETAWVVEKNNSEQIAESVRDIMSHPEKVKEVTANAREMVLERFDWDKIAKEMRTKVFEKIF
jgi:glycosyltransferase involved in cell wall biosynthesis